MSEISLIVMPWIFFAYTSYRIGNKLHIKRSYPWYIIPLWNFWILAKESEMKIKDLLWILIPIFISLLLGWVYFNIIDTSIITIIEGADGPTSIFIANRLAPDIINVLFPILIYSITINMIYGSVARKMGKEYGVYFILGLLLIYLPPLLLAFESIDEIITTNKLSNMFAPLTKEEEKAGNNENDMYTKRENERSYLYWGGILLLIFFSIGYRLGCFSILGIG